MWGIMKVAFFTDTYEPQVNGVVSSIKLFRKHLDADVEIFSPGMFPSVRFFPYPEYRIAFPLLAPLYFRRFDVIHVHTPATVGLAGVVAAKLNNVPLVGSYPTLLPEYAHYLASGKMKSILIKFIWLYTKWFYNNCNIVIAPSEETKQILERHGIKNVIALPAGIEKHRKTGRSAARKRFGFSRKDKIVLHVGRVTKEKNIELIIDSVRKLDDEKIKLVIASDGPHRNYLEQYSSDANVVFTGYLSQRDLELLYAASDAFAFSSETETQGLVLLEAAASGLPAVVLDSPVTAGFTRENRTGIVSSKDGFSKSIEKALYDKRLRKFFIKTAKKLLQGTASKYCRKGSWILMLQPASLQPFSESFVLENPG